MGRVLLVYVVIVLVVLVSTFTVDAQQAQPTIVPTPAVLAPTLSMTPAPTPMNTPVPSMSPVQVYISPPTPTTQNPATNLLVAFIPALIAGIASFVLASLNFQRELQKIQQ